MCPAKFSESYLHVYLFVNSRKHELTLSCKYNTTTSALLFRRIIPLQRMNNYEIAPPDCHCHFYKFIMLRSRTTVHQCLHLRTGGISHLSHPVVARYEIR